MTQIYSTPCCYLFSSPRKHGVDRQVLFINLPLILHLHCLLLKSFHLINREGENRRNTILNCRIFMWCMVRVNGYNKCHERAIKFVLFCQRRFYSVRCILFTLRVQTLARRMLYIYHNDSWPIALVLSKAGN